MNESFPPQLFLERVQYWVGYRLLFHVLLENCSISGNHLIMSWASINTVPDAVVAGTPATICRRVMVAVPRIKITYYSPDTIHVSIVLI